MLNPANDKNDSLEVRFGNNSQSENPITNIQLMAMGKAGKTTSTPSGEWIDRADNF